MGNGDYVYVRDAELETGCRRVAGFFGFLIMCFIGLIVWIVVSVELGWNDDTPSPGSPSTPTSAVTIAP